MTLQKRWDRHYEQGYSVSYWVDIEKPVIILIRVQTRL